MSKNTFNQYTISEVGKGNRTNVHIEYATNIHVYIYINRMLNALNVFKPEYNIQIFKYIQQNECKHNIQQYGYAINIFKTIE